MTSKPAGSWFYHPAIDADYSFFVKNASLRRCSTDTRFRDFWIQCALINALAVVFVSCYLTWWACGLPCGNALIRSEAPIHALFLFLAFTIVSPTFHIVSRHRPRVGLALVTLMLLLLVSVPPILKRLTGGPRYDL